MGIQTAEIRDSKKQLIFDEQNNSEIGKFIKVASCYKFECDLHTNCLKNILMVCHCP
jgi:hypothetical protein